MGCRDRENERKRLRDTERRIKYSESRQNGVKREKEEEEEAKGHREIYRKQPEGGEETERKERKRLRDTERQIKYTVSRQKGVKRER
jgi:hypothetical protein